jgi:hypothetical protein
LAYGVADVIESTSQFFTLNPYDHVIRALGEPHGESDIESIAIHPITGDVYAASGIDAPRKGYLYQIDRTTGTLMPIGSTGFAHVEALAFHPRDTSLWGWAVGHGLLRIDPITGAGQLVWSGGTRSSALAWSDDGNRLYGIAGNTLWAFDPTTMTMTTIATNIPANSLFLDVRPDGRLLGGVDDDQHLTLFLYDLASQQIIARTNVANRFDDVEALAWPGACADRIFASIPLVIRDTPAQGAPGSYFPLHAVQFAPHTGVDVTVNGSWVGRVQADVTGQVALTLFYDSNAPPGRYIIDFTEQHPTGLSPNGTSWSAESSITIDRAAPQRSNTGDAPILPGTLRQYLSIIRA